MDGRRLFSCGLALALVACEAEEDEPAAQADTVRPVLLGRADVATVARERIQAGPRVSGALEARRAAVVRAETGGSVLAIGPEVGDAVRRGQLLARIESETLGNAVASARASVASAEEQLALARLERDRTARLVSVGALAQRDLDTADAAVASAEARLEEGRAQLSTSEQQLADSTVESPIDGVVSERAVNQGDVVAPGAPLFTILDPSSMRLEAAVPSEDLGTLVVGAPVHFTVRGYPEQVFVGTITAIAPAADRDTRQIPILVEIPNEGGRLVANLFAEGRVASRQREALVVPSKAIETSGTSPTVARVQGGKIESVPVILGVDDPLSERVEVVRGLRAGDVVLLRGTREIPAGTPVQIEGQELATGEGAAEETPAD